MEIAPNLVAAANKRAVIRRSVAEALLDHRSVQDIRGSLSVEAIFEYLQVWDLVDGFILHPGVRDIHSWSHLASSQYSAQLAYQYFFLGEIEFEPWKRLWKTWTPLRCKFFLWLAVQNRCWTANHLARHGLSHPERCPLCDQDDETVQHLLTSCVFSRSPLVSSLAKCGSAF